MGQVISLATGKPIETVRQVVIMDAPAGLPTLRTSLKYTEIICICNRAYRAAKSSHPTTARLAIETLREYASGTSDARPLASLYLDMLARNPPGPKGAA